MVNIIGKIENFNPNKSYPEWYATSKRIPVFTDRCSCHFGYNCDDEHFDGIAYYLDVAIDDIRDSEHERNL